MLLGLFLLAGALCAALLLLPFYLELEYLLHQTNGSWKIAFWIWKLPIAVRVSHLERLGTRWLTEANIQVPKASRDVFTVTSLEKLKRLLSTPLPRAIKFGSKLALFLLREIEKLEVKLRYSTGEAALTGISAGAAWGLISIALSIIGSRVRFLHQPQIQIKPVFGPIQFECWFHCIFKIRLGHIIVKYIKQQLKLGKGGCRYGRESSD